MTHCHIAMRAFILSFCSMAIYFWTRIGTSWAQVSAVCGRRTPTFCTSSVPVHASSASLSISGGTLLPLVRSLLRH